MKNKVVELDQAVAAIKDGQTILFGDWHGENSAEEIITGVIEKNVKNITAVAVSGGMPDQGVGRMIVNQGKQAPHHPYWSEPRCQGSVCCRRAGC